MMIPPTPETPSPTPPAPRVSVVILTWNSARCIDDCLAAAAAQTGPAIEIRVVDNDSRDDTVDRVRRHPGVQVTVLPENRGYAAGNNAGIRLARGEYVLVLNDDCIPEPGFAAALAAALDDDPRAGSASGLLLKPGGATVDSTGIIPHLRRLSPYDRGEGASPDRWTAPDRIFGPSGAAACYRKAALDDVAGDGEVFDEDFLAYYEDVDLAWRLQKRGWHSVFSPQARATHERRGPSRSGGELFWTGFVNRYFALIKNASPSEILRLLPLLAVVEPSRFAVLALRRRGGVRALIRLLRLLPAMLRKRRILRQRTIVPGFSARQFDPPRRAADRPKD